MVAVRSRSGASDYMKQAERCSPLLLRGLSPKNTCVADHQCWGEVIDHHHRFYRNILSYLQRWEMIKGPKPSFTAWVDRESIQIDGAPRDKLNGDVVRYYSRAERAQFAIDIRRDGTFASRSTGMPINTGDKGWMLIVQDDILYGCEKVTKSQPRVHHTSLSGGECIQAAGMMVVRDGVLDVLYLHSGHYCPTEYETLVLLRYLKARGVALDKFQVDVQHIEKKKLESHVSLVDNAVMKSADRVYDDLVAREDDFTEWVCLPDAVDETLAIHGFVATIVAKVVAACMLALLLCLPQGPRLPRAGWLG